MKIYTKINYKWLDGQLVKTSSKSFEYEGDLTLCGGGGGGGDKGGGGGGGSPISMGTVTGAITDPVGTATGAISDTVNIVGDNLADAGDIVGDNMQDATDAMNTNLEVGTEGIGMNEGVATTLGDAGDAINEGVTSAGDHMVADWVEDATNTNLDTLHDYGKAVNDVVSDELGRWSDFAMEKTIELGKFTGVIGDAGDAVDDPTNIKSNDQGIKNKAKANLKVNKSKGRARQSLRIG